MMPDYYVQVRKGGVEHIFSGYVPAGRAMSWCGEDLGSWPIRKKKTEPSGRVCKRCERIAEKEKR